MSQVVVYTKPNCAQCRMTKKLLDSEGLTYEVRDVVENESYKDDVRGFGYSSLPVLVVDGQAFNGFHPEVIRGIKTA